jgi:hypothetical protein
MSSAFYPLGMKSYNNHTPQGGYKTWKGSGIYQNPTGIISGNQRPQTNKDYRNVAVYKHGMPRPIKHYRKGTNVPYLASDDIAEYYSNTHVKSSRSGTSIGQLIDRPGSVIMKDNANFKDGTENCGSCLGQAVVSNWAPINNLTEKPQANTMNSALCCNAQKKARRRVLPASTILKKNYYTTHNEYLYNRCQTFDQRAFNFYSSGVGGPEVKPGGPESYPNTYVANCNPNVVISEAITIGIINRVAYILHEESIITDIEYDAFKSADITTMTAFVAFLKTDVANSDESIALLYKVIDSANDSGIDESLALNGASNGCKVVVYKPNNYQYAQQGAVSSSARMLRLNVNTINTNLASIKKPIHNIVYKNKTPACDTSLYRKSGDAYHCIKL